MPKFTPLELLEVVPWQFDEPEARLWAVARIKELEDKLDSIAQLVQRWRTDEWYGEQHLLVDVVALFPEAPKP